MNSCFRLRASTNRECNTSSSSCAMVAGDLGSLSSTCADFGASLLWFLSRFFRPLDVEDFSLPAILKAWLKSEKRPRQAGPSIAETENTLFRRALLRGPRHGPQFRLGSARANFLRGGPVVSPAWRQVGQPQAHFAPFRMALL